jgi:hypothetical protein
MYIILHIEYNVDAYVITLKFTESMHFRFTENVLHSFYLNTQFFYFVNLINVPSTVMVLEIRNVHTLVIFTERNKVNSATVDSSLTRLPSSIKARECVLTCRKFDICKTEFDVLVNYSDY